jgi:hypothetical protein
MQLVNADYVISGLRQALFAAHCQLVDTRDEADIIIEPRLGTLGNNGHEVVYGLPQTNSLAQASATLARSRLLPPLPELSVGRSHFQFGLAKVAVFAYDRKTREPVWQSESRNRRARPRMLGLSGQVRSNVARFIKATGSPIRGTKNTLAASTRCNPCHSRTSMFSFQKAIPAQVAQQPAQPNSSGMLNPAQQR